VGFWAEMRKGLEAAKTVDLMKAAEREAEAMLRAEQFIGFTSAGGLVTLADVDQGQTFEPVADLTDRLPRPKVKMVCRECGGTDVKRDAWAEWDEDLQEWVLSGDPFDAAQCDDCCGETGIDEVPLDSQDPDDFTFNHPAATEED
jgi:hypothetical protein